MKKLITIGSVFVGLAFIGLGTEHFIFKDFITGRSRAWPEEIGGKLVWAYLTGVLFIGIGMAIIMRKKARFAAMLAAAVLFLWALLRNIPLILDDAFFGATWTSAGKALVLTGGALAVAATMPEIQSYSEKKVLKFMNLKSEFIIVGRICLGVFLLVTGIQHFIFTPFVATLIPEWFPGDAIFWTYFAGVALMAGGIGLFIPQTAKWAALLSGLMVFSWLWIIHIPRIFVSTSDAIAVFEALAVSGIAFIIAGYTVKQSSPSNIYHDQE